MPILYNANTSANTFLQNTKEFSEHQSARWACRLAGIFLTPEVRPRPSAAFWQPRHAVNLNLTHPWRNAQIPDKQAQAFNLICKWKTDLIPCLGWSRKRYQPISMAVMYTMKHLYQGVTTGVLQVICCWFHARLPANKSVSYILGRQRHRVWVRHSSREAEVKRSVGSQLSTWYVCLCMYVCMYVFMCACMYACLYVCMYLFVYWFM